MPLQEGLGPPPPQQAFVRWNDPHGTPLIAINRDGTIACLGIETPSISLTQSGEVVSLGVVTEIVDTASITFSDDTVQTTAWPGTTYVIAFNDRYGRVYPIANDYSFNQISGLLGLGQIPAGGNDTTYLRGDGSWAVPSITTTNQSGDYTPLVSDDTIFCTGISHQTITLPTDGSIYVGKIYTVKVTGTGPVTVLTSGPEYSGSLYSSSFPNSSSLGSAVTLQYDGTEYWILSAVGSI